MLVDHNNPSVRDFLEPVFWDYIFENKENSVSALNVADALGKLAEFIHQGLYPSVSTFVLLDEVSVLDMLVGLIVDYCSCNVLGIRPFTQLEVHVGAAQASGWYVVFDWEVWI